MISLNLLPDIKQQYLKAQRTKRLFIVVSMLVAAGFVAIAVLVALWVGAQRLYLNDLQSDINNLSNELSSQEDLSKIVTIQKQLDALPVLYDDKTAMERLPEYLKVIIPNNVKLSNLQLSSQGGTLVLELRGQTDTVKTVNVFADTLKNSRFVYGEGQTSVDTPFSNVQVANFSIEQDEEEDIVTGFNITLEVNELIFDNTLENAEIKVPNITSSPSVTERPGALFIDVQETDDEGGAQ